MKMKANGRLRHHYDLEYSATIALAFTCEESARACVRLLWPYAEWQQNGRGLVAVIPSKDLDAFKKATREKFGLSIYPCERAECKGQCQKEEIDSVAHSIDFGPYFSLTLEAEHVNQMALPL